MTPPPPTIDAAAFRESLRQWYREHHRDLPWRRTRDAYAIWVSEIMLQQTTVEAVLPHYRRFLERFPDVHALAQAREEEVLQAWSGLGYYRRARNLHKAARLVASEHQGQFPTDLDVALDLPGVGRYTAGAILSFAFDRPLPIVDANVARVLARLLLIEEPLGSSRATTKLWAGAERLVSRDDPATHNQALMELGARVCTPTDPSCLLCPVHEHCAARTAGRERNLPNVPKRKAAQDLRLAGIILQRGDHIVLQQRPQHERLGGQWEIPTAELPANARSLDAVLQLARDVGAVVTGDWHHLGTVRHSILHYRIRLDAFHAQLRTLRRPLRDDLRPFDARARAAHPITTLTRKALHLLPHSLAEA